MTTIPKTLMAAILASIAYVILYILVAALLSFKNGIGDAGDGTTLAKLIQDGVASGLAAYGVLRFSDNLFSNLQPRVLVAAFLVLLALVYVGQSEFNAEYFIPQQRILAFRAAITSAVISFAGALIAAVIYIRQRDGLR